jgi:hypothetical protein
MSVKIGSIIDAAPRVDSAIDDGKSAVVSNPPTGVGDAGRTDGPIIAGYDPGTGDFQPVVIDDSGAYDAPKRRGRKLGWRKSATVEAETVRPSLAEIDFAGILVSVHGMMALLTGIPECDLEKNEGAKLAEAIKGALKYHTSLGISPQVLAYIHLASTAGGIYGTRVIAYRLRKTDERKKSGNVTPINRPAPAMQPVASPGHIVSTVATGTDKTTFVGSVGSVKASSPADLWFEPAKDEM